MWPRMTGFEGSITLSPTQLAMLIEGIDWPAQQRIWTSALAGWNNEETHINYSKLLLRISIFE